MNGHNEKESHSIGSIAIGIVFCVWFFGSMAAAFFAANAGQPGWAAFCLGQIFLVIGIMVVYKQIKQDALEPIFFVFSIVGFFMMVCGFLWQTGAGAMRDWVVDMVPLLLLGLFLVVGILIVISALIGKNRRSKCTIAVLGKCVEVKWSYRSSGDSGTMFYCPVYEYAYNGMVYTGCEEVYLAENYVLEGEYRKLFINPKKPEVFYEEGRTQDGSYFVLLCFGLFFIAVSSFVIAICYQENFK